MSNATDLKSRVLHSGTYGNVSVENFTLNLANGDAIASTHDIGQLGAGVMALDATLIVTDAAAAASSTLDLGLKSVTGTNQDDPLFFFQTQAITATGLFRAARATTRFITAQDMFLRATVRGAAQTDAVVAQVILLYRFFGNL